jgi:4-carboxymuconolactone decarboxylase
MTRSTSGRPILAFIVQPVNIPVLRDDYLLGFLSSSDIVKPWNHHFSNRQGLDMNQERFEKGLAVRREVLGAEYVDRSLANADDFTRPMQELVTEYCWGEVWTQPELARKTRSMINIAMISALNRPHELQLHVRGALRNGCSKEEIRAVLLQVAIYCGVPAAIDGFRVASAVLKEEGV